ncbi:hypothetical protein EsH8_X_000080 [Colletotrichum jinshuiense]
MAGSEESSGTNEDEYDCETDTMYNLINRDMKEFKNTMKESKETFGRPTLAKNRTFIAVCSQRSASNLSMKLDDLKGHRLKIWKSKSEKCHELVLVVSGHLNDIRFHVPRNIRSLIVMRCGFSYNINSQLCIDGSSTFRDTKLRKWQSRKHKGSLFLGRGVGISIDPNGKGWAQAKQSFQRNFTEDEKRDIRQQFQKMRNQPQEGERWWHEWKGIVASLMGILSCGVKLTASIKASAGGAFFHYQYGMMSLKAGAAYAKGATVATAAGPAVLVGMGIAAAVYFMPWETLLDWFESIFSWCLGGLKTIWSWFREWLASFRSTQGPTDGGWKGESRAKMPRPMKF